MPHRALRDSYGRPFGDLRVSITDRCNFQCTYCISVENIEWKKKWEILSYQEIERLVSVFVSLGVYKVRVTGGEPLVRSDVTRLVAGIAAIPARTMSCIGG